MVDEDPALLIQKELENLTLKDDLITNKNKKHLKKEDFGSKTLRNLEEKAKKNENKRKPFKPFRYTC